MQPRDFYPTWKLCTPTKHYKINICTKSNDKATVFYMAIWAPSSEFVSSSIPSWQILTAHAQPFSGARDLAFCLKVPLDSLLVWASSKGPGETTRMRRLAWIFAARKGDKNQIRLTWSISDLIIKYWHLEKTCQLLNFQTFSSSNLGKTAISFDASLFWRILQTTRSL